MPLKFFTKSNFLIIFVTLIVCLSNSYAGKNSSGNSAKGGANGGGGNHYEEIFFAAAAAAIDNINQYPEFSDFAAQAETIFEIEPKLTFVDHLTDCDGQAIIEPGQYAYSCQGEIRLVKKYWKMWLANKFQAQAHIHRIFHETLRVTSYSNKKVTNDGGFRTTNKILKVTDLLTNPKCLRSHEHLMPAEPWTAYLKEGVTFTSTIGISENEDSAELAMNKCKIDIEWGMEFSEFYEELSACKALALKYSFVGKLKNDTTVDLGYRGKFVTAVSSRKCIGSETPMKNY